MAAPIKRTPKNEHQLFASNQTPAELRQDHLTPTPTKERRLPNAGSLRASGTESYLKLSIKTRTIGLAFFHAVTTTVNGEHLRMMQQPIEQRRGKDLISSQEIAPPSKASIGSQHDRSMLIAGSNQLEEVDELAPERAWYTPLRR